MGQVSYYLARGGLLDDLQWALMAGGSDELASLGAVDGAHVAVLLWLQQCRGAPLLPLEPWPENPFWEHFLIDAGAEDSLIDWLLSRQRAAAARGRNL